MNPSATTARTRSLAIINLFAIEPVEEHAGQGPNGYCRDCAGQHDACDHKPRVRKGHGQREYRDVVELIANFTYDLSHPCVAVVTILAQKLEELTHGSRNNSLQVKLGGSPASENRKPKREAILTPEKAGLVQQLRLLNKVAVVK